MNLKTLLILFITLASSRAVLASAQQPDGPPEQDIPLEAILDITPQNEPLSRYANPPSYVVKGQTYQVMNSAQGYRESGIASWYGRKFHDRPTSSGETYDMFAMTAAHKTLPIPSYVKVSNPDNGKQVIVKVNDRGPFHDDRLIDLSYAAARRLGFAHQGTAQVEIEVIDVVKESQPSRFYFQLAAFTNYHNAKNYLSQISQTLNLPLKISNIIHNQQSLYRVQIGPLQHSPVMQQIQASLRKHGISHLIVSE